MHIITVLDFLCHCIAIISHPFLVSEVVFGNPGFCGVLRRACVDIRIFFVLSLLSRNRYTAF
jgi:hypothetical protein